MRASGRVMVVGLAAVLDEGLYCASGGGHNLTSEELFIVDELLVIPAWQDFCDRT